MEIKEQCCILGLFSIIIVVDFGVFVFNTDMMLIKYQVLLVM